MSREAFELPNEIIGLILFHCQTPKDYLSQSLINHQWSNEARRIKSLMKTRFTRKIVQLNQRSIIWNFDIRVSVVGYGQHMQRHGLEECIQNYHRVGGPSASVYYLHRSWNEGKLHGFEIVREINEIWYSQFYRREEGLSDEPIIHPYEGLTAIDFMREHRRHVLVPSNAVLPMNCDYLGKILFQHQWNDGTLEESRQFDRKFVNIEESSDLIGLFNFLDHIDLQE